MENFKQILIEKCNKAIDIEIKKEAREEAKEIIRLTNDKQRNDFIKYHEKDQGNVCCLVLDNAKYELISTNKLTLKPDDNFGHPMFEE